MALDIMLQQISFEIFTRNKSEREVQIQCALCNLDFF